MSETTSTRDLLLEAAISIIETEGESHIRVDRVVEAAGFTKPVLYHHFADRDDLIVAAQTERYSRALRSGLEQVARAVSLCRTQEEFLDLMREWITSFGTAAGVERRKVRIEVLGSAVSRPRLHESVIEADRKVQDQVADLLGVAKARGWLKVDFPVGELSVWFFGLVLGRHLAESDTARGEIKVWDQITEFVFMSMILGVHPSS